MSAPIPVQTSYIARAFTQRFSSTPHGARLARLLGVCQLAQWGIPYGCALSDDAALVVGELASNAVTHGLVPGRDFELHLDLDLDAYALHIAVSDTRTDCFPPPPGTLTPPPPATGCGYGLHLVDTLAARWGVRERACGGPGKTVWAELELIR